MNIAWIGTGVMGLSMAGHLLEAGHSVRAFSRTRARAQPLLDAGARWGESPAAAARGADVICTMVGYPADVEQVVLGTDGVLAEAARGSLLIDFTTSSPDLARRIHEAALARGVAALDAPVSGGDVGARNAALSIMAGGDPQTFDRARPLLDILGKTVVLQGPAGSGQHTKMVNQIVIATAMIGVCEGLLYARRSGLDPERILESIGGGAAASWSLAHLYPRMLQDDMEPGFMVEHFLKDMEIALEECRRMNLELPGLQMARDMYNELTNMGYARNGTQSLIKLLECGS